ncbi:unnamed protein product [Linum trigynum]|uniref:Uncharacterized protein n=1 Tax=Linum trigynum TaxID=586398 RepID=A0AAV2EQ79_9ROSI
MESAGGSDGGGEGGFLGSGEEGAWSEMLRPGMESMEKYYRDMTTMYLGDGHWLSNYAKFLKETSGDSARAEECCERAILVTSATSASCPCTMTSSGTTTGTATVLTPTSIRPSSLPAATAMW